MVTTGDIEAPVVNYRADHALIISSDGHAMPRMRDYRKYLESRYHSEFDAFMTLHRAHGSDLGTSDPAYKAGQLDGDVLQDWTELVEAGSLEGISDPARRLELLDREGIAGEVLFPDFGLPFELAPRVTSRLGHSRSPGQIEAGNRAHNRWLVEFCSIAPARFAGMALVGFGDVDAAIREIRWARESGLKGIVLPAFDEAVPLYHPRHDPIWRTLTELEMPVNSHVAMSSTTTRVLPIGPTPHPACALPIFTEEGFFCTRQILAHLIWGGVLERYPTLEVVLTEQGSGWIVGRLEGMDYTYEGSYLRRDLREVIRHKPSEYFQRQVYLGSSIFSRAEIEARHEIGLDKMMLGMDYPHHEGTWGVGEGTTSYLQATLGAARVPVPEAELMLSRTACARFGFDPNVLEPIARRIGPSMSSILTPPVEDRYLRGDVKKPMGVWA